MAKTLTPYQKLAELGFSPPVYVEDASSLTEVFPDARQAGIYVLHLADGWKYVGQSVAVNRRFLQHLESFSNIRAVSFRPTPRQDLDATEQAVVDALEALGVRLRNVRLVSFTAETTRFAEVMSPSDQDRWLTDLTYVDSAGPRPASEPTRARAATHFQRWLAACDPTPITPFLTAYLAAAIPAPLRTEQSFWSLSCRLPRRRTGFNTRCRLNINHQEVLCIFEDQIGLAVYFQLAASPLRAAYGRTFKALRDQYPDLELHLDLCYKPGGTDQLRLIAPDLPVATALLAREPVRRALRRFNLSLMRKGRSFWWQSHSFQLADACLEPLSSLAAGAAKMAP
ncbi:MAG: GIY-YIG nuclease family protein [Thermoanaerobaculaceae bacterium]|jgi:hypothetical protein